MRTPTQSRTLARCKAVALRLAGLFALLACACSLRAQAVPASLLLPSAVAYDAAGDLFFADARRNQVYELTLAGTLRVVAGTGEQGFAGDDASATAALLNSPRGLAVGSDGTVYIADTGDDRIRAVSSGTIRTVAGSGVHGYGGDGAAATQAALRQPTGLALDASGALLICDTGNQRVRRVSAGTITTLAGTGVQGFSGDAGAATAATLDTPTGIAVAVDGRIFLADAHNQRIRVIAADGTISTFAGSGVPGYAGDGAQAVAAQLNLPMGVAVGSDGAVLIADAGNQRIRSVASTGIITTVAGTGVQGTSADGAIALAALLNTPRALALQPSGQPALADAGNALVREVTQGNALYTLAVLATPRVSGVKLTAPSTVVYGTGSLTASVAGSAAAPQGSVTLLDNGISAATAQLTAATATLPLAQLAAGAHALIVAYSGDGLNNAATSAASNVTVTPAPLTASATAASAVYGATLPPLSGSLVGVLARDAAQVGATYTTAASVGSAPGTYPILVTLTGQASVNYSVATSSGALVIAQAPVAASLQAGAQSYAGLPLLLSATVATSTTGTPSGTVDFLDGSAVVGSATLQRGSVAFSYAGAVAGTHTLTLRYRGDTNFLPGVSSPASVTMSAMPDFAIGATTATAATQNVQGGAATSFPLTIAPQNGAFTGAITLAVSGLPPGATASFAPTALVPGSTGAATTLTVQTVALAAAGPRASDTIVAMAATALILLLPFAGTRRRPTVVAAWMVLICTSALTGCGARTATSASTRTQTSVLTVTATGTNLAGNVVSHTCTLTLSIY